MKVLLKNAKCNRIDLASQIPVDKAGLFGNRYDNSNQASRNTA